MPLKPKGGPELHPPGEESDLFLADPHPLCGVG